MYLSKIVLRNWRSYADGEFNFTRPSDRRPLVLIGAMNGHGKTSFLFALYLGLFGRHGLRHTEGFAAADGTAGTFYREAILKLRRTNASNDEPTSVELVFSPVAGEEASEIRLLRQWFFSSSGQLKQGDAFESVSMYIDGKAQRLISGTDSASQRLERILFRSEAMPAFFFDGEQAQSLINNSGQDGMKKAVEVLFGTRVIDEASESIRDYITKMSSKIGGKRSNDQQQIELDSKVQERDRAQAELVNKSKHQEELQARHRDLSNRRQGLLNEVRTRGGDRREEIETLHADRIKGDNQLEIAVKQIDDVWLKMGVGLALSRYVGALRDRLAAEDAREKWEVVRDTTNRRIDEIVETAAPSPRESDDVLHALTDGNWQRLRTRIRSAIESIHNPPPIGCSESYRHGHAMGDARNRLLRLLDTVRGGNTHEIKRLARNVVDAREQLEEVRRREERNKDLPAELNTLHEQIKAVQDEIDETGRELGAVDKELSVLREQIGEFNVRIGQLQEAVAKARPQQRRLAVAERVRKVLDDLSERLQPITIRRLEDSISQHFTRIADSRYKNGRVSFAGKGTPTLAVPGRPDSLIEMMSGFERRAFGIAFSLALAEITRKRIPLVIDTPLGNADGQYRRRLLRALMDVDLDQVIILTHDAEVTGDLFEEIETKVKQTFLVEYDQRRQESIVRADSYFGGVGR